MMYLSMGPCRFWSDNFGWFDTRPNARSFSRGDVVTCALRSIKSAATLTRVHACARPEQVARADRTVRKSFIHCYLYDNCFGIIIGYGYKTVSATETGTVTGEAIVTYRKEPRNWNFINFVDRLRNAFCSFSVYYNCWSDTENINSWVIPASRDLNLDISTFTCKNFILFCHVLGRNVFLPFVDLCRGEDGAAGDIKRPRCSFYAFLFFSTKNSTRLHSFYECD